MTTSASVTSIPMVSRDIDAAGYDTLLSDASLSTAELGRTIIQYDWDLNFGGVSAGTVLNPQVSL